MQTVATHPRNVIRDGLGDTWTSIRSAGHTRCEYVFDPGDAIDAGPTLVARVKAQLDICCGDVQLAGCSLILCDVTEDGELIDVTDSVPESVYRPLNEQADAWLDEHLSGDEPDVLARIAAAL